MVRSHPHLGLFHVILSTQCTFFGEIFVSVHIINYFTNIELC